MPPSTVRPRFLRAVIAACLPAVLVATVVPAATARETVNAVDGHAPAPTSVSGSAAGPAQRHIVVLRDDVEPQLAAAALLHPLGLAADMVWRDALVGFSVTASPALLAGLARDARVVSVERALTVTTAAQAVPSGLVRIDAQRQPAAGIGSGRVVDVDVAVIDTGVDDHPDLVLASHWDCTPRLLGRGCVKGGSDGNGHGTHVAGTIGALDNGLDVVGIAPGARIHAYKVLDDLLASGSTADIIDAIDHVAKRGDIEVLNLSLSGSGNSPATDRAIEGATKAGVVVVVAAGNKARDAVGSTPANSPNAITVSAITDTDGRPGGAGPACSGQDDALADYSNWGDVVDLAAPGSCITSLRAGGGTATKSGTSMASPHVAGAAALWVAHRQVPPSANRWREVLSGLIGNWATPQAGRCGYRTEHSADPLLHLTACGWPQSSQASPASRPAPPATSRPAPADMSVGQVSWSEGGYLLGSKRWLDVTIVVRDFDGSLLSGAEVRANVQRDGQLYASHVAKTNSRGEVRFDNEQVPAGTYTTVVTKVTRDGRRWDGRTPANRHTVEEGRGTRLLA